MPPKRKWFKPRKHRGWRAADPTETRRRRVLASTDRRKTRRNRYLEAARALQALANVTRDPDTRRKARSDAQHFYRRARKTR